MTYNLKGVEIFSVGTWNGDTYTRDDLNEMVSAFSETKTGVQPFLKIGHDPKQSLIKNEKEFPQRDGKPAAGWIDRIYVVGDKLKADLSEVPEKIYELINRGAYKKVSSEIFWNIKVNNKIYKKMLGAVALLGADTPGVMNLSDILALYKVEIGDGEIKVYDFTNDEKNWVPEVNPELERKQKMDLEQVKKEYSEKLEAQKVELEKVQKEASETAKTLEALKQFKVDAEKREVENQKRQAELEAANKIAQDEKFIAGLEKDTRVSPAMKPYIMELLAAEKKEYSLADKKYTKQELIKETLKLHAAALDVNLEESSSKDYANKEKLGTDEQDKAIKKYAAENKCSYSDAYKEVMKKK